MKIYRIITPVLLLIFLAGNVLAQENDPKKTAAAESDTVFSVKQVERGTKAFEEYCGMCHLPDQFTGKSFVEAWRLQSAFDLFELVFSTMPIDNPGSLKRSSYIDILTYVLSLNGMPAGSTAMSSKTEKLKLISLESLSNGRKKR